MHWIQRRWDYFYNMFPVAGHDIRGWLGFLPHWAVYLIMGVLSIAVLIVVSIVVWLVFIYLERRVIGFFQLRWGPNRAGPQGVLQGIADFIKLLGKESITPAAADKWVHLLAPAVAFIPALMVVAVIPFNKGAIIADLNIGILYAIAISSVAIIGMFMAGWGSANKYALLGAMRAVAQMVSYEVPAVLAVVGVIMVTGSLSMSSITEAQEVPFILMMPLAFVVYFIASTAELNRAPLDLMEAESELVAGYHTEYSGMRFAFFYLGEYMAMLSSTAIMVTVFFSGWKGWLFPPYLWFLVKMHLLFIVFLWMRATLPRVRVDHLMNFAWKFLLPVAFINILIVGVELKIWEDFPWPLLFLNIPLAGVVVVGWLKLVKLTPARTPVERLRRPEARPAPEARTEVAAEV